MAIYMNFTFTKRLSFALYNSTNEYGMIMSIIESRRLNIHIHIFTEIIQNMDYAVFWDNPFRSVINIT